MKGGEKGNRASILYRMQHVHVPAKSYMKSLKLLELESTLEPQIATSRMERRRPRTPNFACFPIPPAPLSPSECITAKMRVKSKNGCETAKK
jgi:hypothetical protein